MDMARTSVNVIGNCLATVVIARWEGDFGKEPAIPGGDECSCRLKAQPPPPVGKALTAEAQRRGGFRPFAAEVPCMQISPQFPKRDIPSRHRGAIASAFTTQIALLLLCTFLAGPMALAAQVAGPLTASSNPNYFKDANGTVLILNGSQTWNTLQDWGSNGSVVKPGFRRIRQVPYRARPQFHFALDARNCRNSAAFPTARVLRRI